MAVVAPNGMAAGAPEIRVLIADDSPAIRTLARYALSAHQGFRVVAQAADGLEALALSETHDPDCVVLDIEMPGMGGFEALGVLRQRSPDLPVILLSGRSDEAAVRQALDCGASAYLDKTSQLVELAETIRRVVVKPVDSSRAGRSSETLAAELSRLEYVVSHELGEPLRIMRGFAELLESRYADVLDDPGVVFVKHIGEAADRMQAMLDDLLVYARAAHLQPRAEVVHVADVVSVVYEALAGTILERGAEATLGDLPVVVADPDMMRTVLRHVVLNALIFNTASVPKVRIEGFIDGPAATITVSDNGIGIDPAQSERVFDLFQRLNTREEYAGTGTGLALCRRLVTLQGGRIDVDASARPGTVVNLTIPARSM